MSAGRMAAEIAEQPAAIERTLAALEGTGERIRSLAEGRRHVLLVARGSSDNAAVHARYLLEVHAGLGASLAAPSLATHYRVDRDLTDTLAVSVSQSGRTEEIVAAQDWAVRHGARTIAITNEEGSPLAEGADLALVTRAGPELAVPATKTFTTQLATLVHVADALGPDDHALGAALGRVPDALRALLERLHGAERDALTAAVELLARTDTVVVSGRGLTLGTAAEVALKLEETNLRPVRGLSYADLRHGPLAVVREGTAVVIVSAADGPLVDDLAGLAAQVRRLGAEVVAIGGGTAIAEQATVRLGGPELPETLAALGLVVPGQVLAERLARHRGLDPDAPPSLAKVTRTDPDGPAG